MNTLSPLFLIPGTARRLALALCLAGAAGPGHAQQPAPTGSIAELMELGIYSEETKGDIDAAMQVYQQILNDTQANRSLAAQALFRLALCHDKKGDLAAATAACEKLIKDYPQEKDLVAAASEYLTEGAALLPAPWQSGEDIDYELRMSGGMKVGLARYSVDAVEIDGRPVWKFTSLVAGGALSASTTEVEAGSMKPIRAKWDIRPMASTSTTYSGGHAEVSIKGLEPRTVELGGVVYDNEEAIHLMRRLPLAVGYKKRFNVIVAISGGLILPVDIEVVGTEKLEIPAGTFDCYRVKLTVSGMAQTFWYHTAATRELVRFEANGVIADLKHAKLSGPDQPTTLKDPTLGFGITVPAGWTADSSGSPEQFKRPTYYVLDPAGTALTSVMAEAQANFGPEQVASLRAYADHQVAMAKKYSQVFEVRPDSWEETTVDGQPALFCIADQMKGPAKSVTFNTFVLIDGNAVSITSYVPAEEADSYRPSYDTIVAGFRGK